MFTQTILSLRRTATVTMGGLAVLALPVLAAGQIHAQAPTETHEARGTLTAAPAAPIGAADTVTDAQAPAAGAAVDSSIARDGTSPEAAGPTEGSTPPGETAAADESGSTETETVQRACDAPDDPHYAPSSGRDADECYANGTFQPGRTYTATHYTNDVRCGSDNVLVPVDAAGAYLSGSADGGADGGSGYLQGCSEEALPIHGRATTRGELDTGGDFTASATADGDRDNPEETSQGWVTVTVSPAGPEYRCGKAYAEGGRADADNPTSEDTADECG